MSDFHRWGYIDRGGAEIVGPLLESAGEFYEGLAVVSVDLECVAIGADGVITEQLSKGFLQWRDGTRYLPPSDIRYCLIDTDGRVVVGPLAHDLRMDRRMSCGVVMVQSGSIVDKFGYVDADGRWILAMGAPEAHRFSEGLGRVRLHGLKGGRVGAHFLDRVRFLDQTGAVAFDGAFEDAGDFAERLARVKVNAKWGYVDKSGNLVITPRFNYASDFTEGIASIIDECGKSGYIDQTGAMVIAPSFAQTRSFFEGLASATADNRMTGYINRSGTWAVPADYDFAGDFSGGLAPVGWSHKYGYIDRQGMPLTPLAYDEAQPITEGMGRVGNLTDGKMSYGFVDSQGKLIIPPKYAFARDFHNGLALVGLDSEHSAYIDKQGTIIWRSPRSRPGWFKQ